MDNRHNNFRRRQRMRLLLPLLLMQAGCQIELYTDLSETDANSMLTELMRNGVAGEKSQTKDGRYSLRTDEHEVALANSLLRDAGLPREEFQTIGDIFPDGGLISSPLEERVRYIFALSQQLQDTLTQIDGVITARVSVVLPENNPFAENAKPSSASVFIKYHPESNLRDIQSEIKLLVEKSIEGLTYDKISVTMLPSRQRSAVTAQQTSWRRIGPLRLAVGSVAAFCWIVGGLLLLAGGSLACCAMLYNRLREVEASSLYATMRAANDGIEVEPAAMVRKGILLPSLPFRLRKA